jgi:hypothetical protein
MLTKKEHLISHGKIVLYLVETTNLTIINLDVIYTNEEFLILSFNTQPLDQDALIISSFSLTIFLFSI